MKSHGHWDSLPLLIKEGEFSIEAHFKNQVGKVEKKMVLDHAIALFPLKEGLPIITTKPFCLLVIRLPSQEISFHIIIFQRQMKRARKEQGLWLNFIRYYPESPSYPESCPHSLLANRFLYVPWSACDVLLVSLFIYQCSQQSPVSPWDVEDSRDFSNQYTRLKNCQRFTRTGWLWILSNRKVKKQWELIYFTIYVNLSFLNGNKNLC